MKKLTTYLLVLMTAMTLGSVVNMTSASMPEFVTSYGNSVDCENLNGYTIYDYRYNKNMCLVQKAMAEKNEKYCENVSTSWDKSNCYRQVALLTEKLDLCKQIVGDSYTRKDCEKSVKTYTSNGEFCSDKSITDVDTCYSDLALHKRDLTVCDKVTDETVKADCQGNVNKYLAIDKQDSQYCEKIPATDASIWLRDNCFMQLALDTKKANLCEKIPKTDDGMSKGGSDYANCISAVAPRIPDISLCKRLDDEDNQWMKSNCISQTAVAMSDLNACKTLKTVDDTSTYAQCVSGIAAKKKDVSLCEALVKEEASSKVMDSYGKGEYSNASQCFEIVAVVTENPAVCDKITDDWQKNDCKSQLASVLGKPELCKEIDDKYNQGYCYSGIASETQNTSLCALIPDPSNRGSCLSSVATQKEDVSICKQIMNPTDRGYCVSTIASSKSQPDLCGDINSVVGQASCYQSVATSLSDATVCQKISSSADQDQCLFSLATMLNSKKYCGMMSDYSFKKLCKDQVDFNKGDEPPFPIPLDADKQPPAIQTSDPNVLQPVVLPVDLEIPPVTK